MTNNNHLVFMLQAPTVKSSSRVWERKLAALVRPLDESLLTRDEINDLAAFLKARAQEIGTPAEVRDPDWTWYERYGHTPAIIFGDLSVNFRGVNPTPGGTLANYLADLDIPTIYSKITRK